ncbi:transposase, partial [Pelagicoccus sp. SDUM812002]|uniref:REP-associated tyrosine transposase n=1 Tax=Pelagicoccus sp. SDUM812002 TaxID=3041266 RepID=UPI00280F7B03
GCRSRHAALQEAIRDKPLGSEARRERRPYRVEKRCVLYWVFFVERRLQVRKTQTLRRGRVSVPNARYFITICTRKRKPVLCRNEAWEEIMTQLEHQEAEGDFSLCCMVLMPDHVHVVFRLGTRLKLGQVVGKFKSRLAGLADWQDGFYDHRLRSDEGEEAYGLYLFMNPYRANLISLDKDWIFWKRCRAVPFAFEEVLAAKGNVPIQWITESEAVRIAFLEKDTL